MFENKRIIGFRNNWDKILREKGISVIDHKIVKDGFSENGIEKHKTAINRYSLATPVQSLYRHNYLNREYSFFDYGCGKGDDLNIVKRLGVDASKASFKSQAGKRLNIGPALNRQHQFRT
ncbi:MAG: hypothetical protein ABIJ59_04300 [Pseudomonadota bacterium]